MDYHLVYDSAYESFCERLDDTIYDHHLLKLHPDGNYEVVELGTPIERSSDYIVIPIYDTAEETEAFFNGYIDALNSTHRSII